MELRRHARVGFLQTFVLPKLGLYPWECGQCRHIYMLRKRRLPRQSRLPGEHETVDPELQTRKAS